MNASIRGPRVFCWLAVCLGLCLSSLPAVGAPPYRAFAEGLRERHYFDMALLYLDQIESDPSVPADVKAVIDYDRAVTLIGLAGESSDPSTKAKRLDEATAAMERFVAAHPEHPLVAEAQTERGKVLLGKARVAILEANSPGNETKAGALRQDARRFLAEARKIFESARARYEEKWKSFGPFVEEDDAADRQERDAAQNALIQSLLFLADCTYREAQTYPEEDPKRKELLNAAADQYEQIHADYRKWVGGLYARLGMAKCYEEQAPRPEDGETLTPDEQKAAREMLNIAEAIYSELLDHETRDNPSAARMQEFAFWYKLIVRNHPVLSDHQLVVDLASEWLQGRRGTEARTTTALGVRWERAQAYEDLANAEEVSEAAQSRLLRAALDDAEFVNAFGGEFRDVSRAMIQRMKSALGRGEGDPKDFDEANGLAQTLQNQIDAKTQTVATAKTPEEKQAAETALAAHLDKTARILQLALSLAGPGTDRSSLNAARYRLAYVEYQRDRPYDAAVLGSFVGRKYKNVSPQLALDASYLGLAAFYKLYHESDASGREFALANLREMADFIAGSFPDSEQANESRLMLGRLYMQADDFPQAAEWFSKVPASSEQAREARIMAGRAFWDAYLTAQREPEESRLPIAELDQLRVEAERFLREGLALASKQLPAEAAAPEGLMAGKATLAQIANLNGNYQEAIDLLTGEPRPVTGAITVEEGEPRPKEGAKSAAFATIVRQQLLRSYIGLQQMDPAIAQMQALQAIGGAGNTAVFVDLGRQIKEELERMPAGPERDKVMSAFDMFLGKLAEMEQGQTFGSLVWIGETYFGLAQAASEPKRSAYFDRAAQSYETILNRAGEAGFLPSGNAAAGVRLRLAAVTASRGEYQQAYDLARQVLGQAPRALNAQVETADILKQWGHSGLPESPEKLLLSIQGDDAGEVSVWGWGEIAQRLQRAILAGQASEEFQELYRRARYEIPAARWAYAKTRSDRKQFEEALNKAGRELNAYVAMTPKEEIGAEWWGKLESLYANIQQDQGIVIPKDLEEAVVYTQDEPSGGLTTRVAAVKEPLDPAAEESETVASRDEPASVMPILFGLLLAGGVTGGIVFSMLRGKKRRPIRVMPERLGETPIVVPDFEAKRRAVKPRVAARVDSTSKAAAAGGARQRDAGETAPRKPTKRPRTVDPGAPRTASAGEREGAAPKRRVEKPAGETSSSETPKVVKPRVAKNVRRTKPTE